MKKVILRCSLFFLGFSLLLPGLYHVFWLYTNDPIILGNSIEGNNQIRALNAMMAAMGLTSLWCIYQPENKRNVIISLIIILLMVSLARFLSLAVDGISNSLYILYLTVELLLIIAISYSLGSIKKLN